MVRGRRLAFILVFAWLLGTGGSLAQTPNLRIVVIEGEDAVNVIQQKTAVAPVIQRTVLRAHRRPVFRSLGRLQDSPRRFAASCLRSTSATTTRMAHGGNRVTAT